MNRKKNILCLMAFTLLLLQFPFKTDAASSSVKAIVELGESKRLSELKDPLIITDGRVLVPIREVGDLLSLKVFWDQKTKTAELYGVKKEISLKLGSKTAYVNKKNVTLDVPAKVVNGKTYIPLRFVAESLNEKVQWDSKGKVLSIPNTYAMGMDGNITFWLNRKSGELYQGIGKEAASKIGELEIRVEELRKLKVERLSDTTFYIKLYEAVGTSAVVKRSGQVFVVNGKVSKEAQYSFLGYYPDTNIEQSQGNVLLTDGKKAEFWNSKGNVVFSYDLTELVGKDEIYMIEHHAKEYMVLREYTTQHLILYDFIKKKAIYVHEVISLTPYEQQYLKEIALDRMGDQDPEHIIHFVKEDKGVLMFEYKSKETEKINTYKYKL
ncbi:copper amine oxidase N-terminal domain-containing protein [Paenibacillus sp. IHBB 10380]|uniref:copper amine oxidase N-terminal domain-containing protein n=1 Tax=Paenibacillus sp. IHBB 10380 TaxID=1566358 RepID=UPI0005CFB0B3|nr:copper amine oxidase N-terminal domain-containing protein [Paenibacillus sp. IHBB 10380]AJS58254.1 hypothetical protein UB51_06815 [Paenibacillus sp. IHBB 10380]